MTLTAPVMDVVSCCVYVPSWFFGVGNLCCLGDQMLNIPPRQLWTRAKTHKREYHQTHPSFASLFYTKSNHSGNALTLCRAVKETWGDLNTTFFSVRRNRPEHSSTWFTTHSISHACNDIITRLDWYTNCLVQKAL